jgi:hypothetical protein
MANNSKRRQYIVCLRTVEGDLVFYPYRVNKFILPLIGLGLMRGPGFMLGLLIGLALDCQFIPKAREKRMPDLKIAFLMCGVYVMQRNRGFERLQVPDTIRLFRQFLGDAFITPRLRFLESLSHQRIQIEAACDQIREQASPAQKQWLLTALRTMNRHPLLDQRMGEATIRQIASWIGMVYRTKQEQQHTRSYTPPVIDRESELLAQLGLKKGADRETARKAYYALAKKYHPDRNNHHPESATRFRAVKEAWEALQQLKGWK